MAEPISRAEFLSFVEHFGKAQEVVDAAVAARNELRAKIEAAGISLAVLDQVVALMAQAENGAPTAAEPAKPRIGRPRGSRNRPKADAAGTEAVAAAAAEAHWSPAARLDGRSDGREGIRAFAVRWPSGAPGHADYELGYEEGRQAREAETDAPPPAA